MTPEEQARVEIDRCLEEAGWVVQDYKALNLAAASGVAIREVPMAKGHGEADYVLYVDRKALGAIEAKKVGETLTGVEVQAEMYSTGLPTNLPAWHRPLPFLYLSTGVETRFTNRLDPDPRSRGIFRFHRPETLLRWVQDRSAPANPVQEDKEPNSAPTTLQRRLRGLPPLLSTGMRPAQIEAIQNLERSLAEDRRRALIQMATGSGKTYTAVAQIYRLIKFGKARRVLFLVDRGNLGRQTLAEFQGYLTPDDHRKFTDLYNVQYLQSNVIDPAAQVVITTIQRLYSILKGEPTLDDDIEEESIEKLSSLFKTPVPVVYNPALPPETFDFVYTDECHRSIYNVWRQALDYWDAYLIGLTATPSKQTFAFFQQNLVMEYGHARAVADGVNVDFDVYRIRTKISEQGDTVEGGIWVDRRERLTRRVRMEMLDTDLTFGPGQLNRSVVVESQIRLIIRTFRDRLFTEIFPGRKEVPKTLIFAQDDSHADDIVKIVREEFARGNDFCEKITYKTSRVRLVDPETGAITYGKGKNTDELLSSFRNAYEPRIVVTVDMIATGTDVRPLEIVFFLRDVKSGNYFEQMKGRGSRVISSDELRRVTGDAEAKTRFVIVDAVGVSEHEMGDSPSVDRQPSVSLKNLLGAVAMGNTESDVLSTVASRLARLARLLSPTETKKIEQVAGTTLPVLIKNLTDAIDPEITDEAEALAAREAAVVPLLNPALREAILLTLSDREQTLAPALDELIEAGVSQVTTKSAQETVEGFREYLKTHRDEITALQVLYSNPHGKGPTLKQLKELAARIANPPNSLTPEGLWHAFQLVEGDKVKTGGGKRIADLVSLIRFALQQEDRLAPFAETVEERFAAWLEGQRQTGRTFTEEQLTWLEMIRDTVAQNVTMELDDFDYSPFSQRGGLGKARQVFGSELGVVVSELGVVLV